jgi:hypothetical protein
MAHREDVLFILAMCGPENLDDTNFSMASTRSH